MIVSKAIESALTSETIVVGEDTYLLVLLLYHADLNSHKIFFKSDMKQNLRSETVIRDILSIKESLGVIVCKNILFIHAIAGCDTTSGLFGIGKGSPLKMLKSRRMNTLERMQENLIKTIQQVRRLWKLAKYFSRICTRAKERKTSTK